MEKQELIAKLKDVMPVMDIIDKHNRKLEGIEQRIWHLNSEINIPWRFNFRRDFYPGFLLGACSFWVLGKIFSGYLLGILGWSALIACIVFWIRRSKQLHIKRNAEKEQEIEKRKKEYEKAEQEMIAELAPHWSKIQAVVPQDYISPLFVRTVYGYLVNGRADSMKEAINLFEVEQHRWRMEENQQQMYEQYQTEINNMKEVINCLESRVASAEYEASAAYYTNAHY